MGITRVSKKYLFDVCKACGDIAKEDSWKESETHKLGKMIKIYTFETSSGASFTIKKIASNDPDIEITISNKEQLNFASKIKDKIDDDEDTFYFVKIKVENGKCVYVSEHRPLLKEDADAIYAILEKY